MINAALPFAGERPQQMTRLAAMDADLGAGRLPQEFGDVRERGWLNCVDPKANNVKLIMSINRHDRAGAAVEDRHCYNGYQRISLFCRIGCGAAIGVLLTGGNPWGGLLGAIVGGLWSLKDVQSKEQGTVAITHNGNQRQTQFHGRSNDYNLTPPETRTAMIAENVLGEAIEQQPVPEASGRVDTPTAAHIPQLADLDANRRLVADLGHRSRYGHDVLDVVDLETAAELISSGRAAVYVVTSKQLEDVPRSLVVDGQTSSANRTRLEHYQYVERNFQYELYPVPNAAALDAIPRGTGVPVGMAGVYRNSRELSLPIQTHEDLKGRDEIRMPEAGLRVTHQEYEHNTRRGA